MFQRVRCLLILLLSVAGWGMDAITLQASGRQVLAGHLELLEGSADSLEAALAAGEQGRFRPLPGNLAKGYGNGETWLRFRLEVPPDPPLEAYLEVGPFYLQEVTLFVPQGAGAYRAFTSGTRVPFRSRALPYRDVVFPLGGPGQTLPAGQTATCYLRVRTRSNLVVKPVLWSPPTFMDAAVREGIFFGAFFGIALIMLLANLIQWFIVRERLNLFYAAYLGSVVLYFGGTEGFFSQFLLPGKPWWGAFLGQLSLAFFPLLTVRLFSSLQDLKASHPGWDRWLNRLASWITLGASGAILLGHYYQITAALQVSLLLIGWGTMSFTALRALRRNRQALLYLLAFGPYTLGATLRIMRNLTWLPPSFLSEYGVQIGAFFHICLMTLPQAYLVRRMKRERDEALRDALESAKRHGQQLEAQVEARTSEVRAQQARTAEALVQERMVVTEQRQFLQMVSHEFRTPLAVIDGSAQMTGLAATRSPEEVVRRTGTIRRSTRRLLNILDTWLTQDRIASGLHIMKSDVIQLAEWLQLQVASAREHAPDREVHLRITAIPETLVGDLELLEVALRNLLDNALKYSPKDAPVELLACTRGEQLCLEVVDRGPGLPADELDSIGTRYFRGRGSASTPGLGLGLSLVRTITAQHGGRLELESPGGHGTTARLLLPLARPGA